MHVKISLKNLIFDNSKSRGLNVVYRQNSFKNTNFCVELLHIYSIFRLNHFESYYLLNGNLYKLKIILQIHGNAQFVQFN